MSRGSCKPFFLELPDVSEGPRFGGAPPKGVVPRNPAAQYLLTTPALPVEARQEISLFLNCDFDFIYDNASVLLSDDSVEVIVHRVSSRGQAAENGPFPACALGFRSSQDDRIAEGVYESHKMGGMPFFIHDDEELIRAVTSLMDQGYMQILQLDFPANEEDVVLDVDWPFGDGVFHLLGKTPYEESDWFWFWELQ